MKLGSNKGKKTGASWVFLVFFIMFGAACLRAPQNEKLRITDVRAVSGKAYAVAAGGFVPGAHQYIDRDYTFNYIPDFLKGATCILTAGDDKMHVEWDETFSFRVNVPVTVYVVYGDKLRVLPAWLRRYEDTRWKVTRQDSNPTTLKGIFTLFAKDFPAGRIRLYGDISRALAADPSFQKLKGSTYCMYSVAVVPRHPR